MATELTHQNFVEREQEATMGVVAGGSIAEAIGGIGAGLAGALHQIFQEIAGIG